jgi:tRNA-specific 2-thiouridylase
MKPVPATLISADNGTAEIHLQEPQYGISAGQAAVCYDDDRLLGGGWIVGTSRAADPNRQAA